MSKAKTPIDIGSLLASVAAIDVFLSNLQRISAALAADSSDHKLGILDAFIRGEKLTLCNPVDDDEQEFIEFMTSEFEASHPIWNHFEVTDDFVDDCQEELD